MEIVGDLGARVEREEAGRVVVGDRAVGLDRRVGRALVPVLRLDHRVAREELALDVAELEMDVLGDVPFARLLVDLPFGVGECRFDVHHRWQRLVLDPDRLESFLRDQLAVGRDRRDRVPHVAGLLLAQRLLVLGPRDDAVVLGQILAGDDRVDPRHRERRGGVDRADAGVGVGAAQELRVEHAGQRDVVGVDRAPGHLRQAFDLAVALADDVELAPRGPGAPARPARRLEPALGRHHAVGRAGTRRSRVGRTRGGRRGVPGQARVRPRVARRLPAHRSPPIRAAARSTATKILV